MYILFPLCLSMSDSIFWPGNGFCASTVPALRRLSSGVSLPKTDIREGVEEIQFHDYKHFLTDFRRKTALRVNRDGFHFDLFRAEVVGKIE